MGFEVRGDRTPQGPGALVREREREEYFRLMDQGVSSKAACRVCDEPYPTALTPDQADTTRLADIRYFSARTARGRG
jgi:hypothetical protein